MSKNIMQFRYYKDKNALNYPSGITSSSLISGKIFENYLPIIKLSIKAPENTKFYLNSGIHSIIVGSDGKYELDLNNLTEINQISFDSQSIRNINNNDENSLIIDVVYWSE